MRSSRRTRTPPAATSTTSADPPARAWTYDQIHTLGTSTDLATAASILGISRSQAYKLISRDAFPVPLIRIGATYRVPLAPILTLLHLPTHDDDHARPHRDPIEPS